MKQRDRSLYPGNCAEPLVSIPGEIEPLGETAARILFGNYGRPEGWELLHAIDLLSGRRLWLIEVRLRIPREGLDA